MLAKALETLGGDRAEFQAYVGAHALPVPKRALWIEQAKGNAQRLEQYRLRYLRREYLRECQPRRGARDDDGV